MHDISLILPRKKIDETFLKFVLSDISYLIFQLRLDIKLLTRD